MKKLRFMVILLLLVAGISAQAQTVYITESGKKYHAKNCSLARTGKKGISLKEARALGYTPCKACKADEITGEERRRISPGSKGKKS